MTRARVRVGCLAAVGLTLLGSGAATAFGQLNNLNQDKFIEGLQKRGMGELLVHMAQSETFDDPTDARRIEVEQLRIRANDDRFTLEQRIEACEKSIAALHALIDDPQLARHPKRPMWQVDLAEIILFTHLRTLMRGATEFYEFGVPAEDQARAYTHGVTDALINLTEASERGFFNLQRELPQRPDFRERFELTGLYDRMMNEYRNQRLPYFLAHAAYYTTLLPDSAPYFQNVGKETRMPLQKSNPKEERARLNKQAVDGLTVFTEGGNEEIPESVKLDAQCLAGRAWLELGDAGKAKERLEPVIAAQKQDFNELVAGMTLAKTLAAPKNAKGEGKDIAGAMRQVDALSRYSQVSENVLYQLLLTDLKHRLLLNDAGNDAKKIAQSYGPYENLLRDQPDLSGYIYTRWEQRIQPDTDLKTLPGMVLMGVGDLSTITGRNLMLEADETEDSKQAEDMRVTAMTSLEKAIKLLSVLADRKDEIKSVRAKAMLNLGVATYFTARSDLGTLLKAVEIWTELGNQLPDQAEAATGIEAAVGLLRQLLPDADAAQRKQLMASYDRIIAVLLEKFPDSPTTDNERAYYVYEVLLPQGMFQEAIDILRKVPQGHVTYFDAQRGLIDCEFMVYQRRKAAGEEASQLSLQRDVTRVRKEAESALEAADPEKPLGPLYAAAVARLIDSQLAVERNDANAAVSALEGFEEAYAGHDDLIRQALEYRIIALAGAGRADEADVAAAKMFEQFPDQAAPVIDNVLRDMVVKVDDLNEQIKVTVIDADQEEFRRKATNLARTGERLATRLLDWAKNKNLSDDEMLTFRLVLVKSMSLVGKGEEAAAILKPLLDTYPDDANVLYHLAESIYASASSGYEQAKDEAEKAKYDLQLREANRMYVRLIEGLRDTPKDQPDLKQIWWHSWLRALQISNLRQKGNDQIPSRVEMLRQVDDGLGGPIMRAQFVRLERANK